MSNVIKLRETTGLDIAPDDVLDGAKGCLQEILICGYDNEGKEYFASTTGDAKTILWLLKRCERQIMAPDYE